MKDPSIPLDLAPEGDTRWKGRGEEGNKGLTRSGYSLQNRKFRRRGERRRVSHKNYTQL